jgi:hypothetical protein
LRKGNEGLKARELNSKVSRKASTWGLQLQLRSSAAEGPPKKKSTDPPAHLLNLRSQTHPPTIRLFFPLIFLKYVFGRFSARARGVQKIPQKRFYKKSMSKTFPKISTKNSMSVFPRLFSFYRVFGCFSAMGVQKHYKKRFTKKIVSKSFYKKFDQKSKTDFFSVVFLTFLGVSR